MRKTLCIDGDCETAPSNSSQISPIQESNATDNDDEGDDESDDTMNSIRDTIAERTSLRVMNHLRKVDLTMDDVYSFDRMTALPSLSLVRNATVMSMSHHSVRRTDGSRMDTNYSNE